MPPPREAIRAVVESLADLFLTSFLSGSDDVPDWISISFFDFSEQFVTFLAQATAELPTAEAAAELAADPAVGASGDAGSGTAAPNSAPGAAPSFTDIFRSPVFFVGSLFALFYLFVLAPERRKQRETERKRSALKKNDKVLTTSGIFGTVVTVHPDSDELTIRIDEANNTKIRILRSSIGTVIGGDKEGTSS